MRIKNTALAGAAMTALALAAPAQADLSFQAGDWTVAFDGNVNTFYTITDSRDDNVVLGGLASTETGSGTSSDRHEIRTGLLPAKLGFSASTRANGYDVEAYVSYWPGVTANGVTGRGSAFGNSTVNFRQVFLTFGNENMGTFKLGRDLGIFGSDAILNDMTIMGVGTVSDVTIGGGNTTLGRIGTGYIYADWKSQISYTTPNFNGFQVTAGVTEAFEPFTLGTDADGVAIDGSLQQPLKRDRPAFEAKATYDFAFEGVSGRFWLGGIHQRNNFEGNQSSYNMQALEVGLTASAGPLSGVAYYYNGRGIGTTAQGHQAYSVIADSRRDSDGFYVQGMYTVQPIGTKLGLSYGESNLDRESGDPDALVDKNSSWIAGVYHPLTPNLTLVAEATQTKAEPQSGSSNRERNYALGAILFF